MTLGIKRSAHVFLLAALVLGGCAEEVDTPEPIELTRDANGFYCNMIIVDHPGPKAQVFEKGLDRPIWFPSVRDALTYLMLPGEAQKVLAFYVHDMSRADSWQKPQSFGIWIKAEEAVFVLGSSKLGGMGTRETIPFRDRASARAFIARHGGKIASYGAIPQEYVLGREGDDFGRKSEPEREPGPDAEN